MQNIDVFLFNSLSKQKEKFVPLNAPHVYMYVCGPTVYDYVHIGNMRPVVVFDTLRRFLLALGYEVVFVSNYTDVDDKIIKKAIEENKSEQEISEFFIKAYEKSVSEVGALPASNNPKATDYIQGMIHFIERLISKNAAYVVGNNVYFRTENSKDYGALANINTSDLLVGARIEENKQKENSTDFLLWKQTSEGIKWDSPWGKGRPGWHTECVVMINEVFKRPLIDIHGGGFDLKFPHHENEIAQSKIYSGTSLASFWMHNGFINLGNEKMSKSTGNFITAASFLEKHNGLTLRLMLLSSHYRAPVDINESIIENTNKELDKITRTARTLNVFIALNKLELNKNEKLLKPFYNALADDLNTPNALSELYEIIKKINILLRQNPVNSTEISHFASAFFAMLDTLGLVVNLPKITEEDLALISRYEEARKAKDFAKSDELRAILQVKGLI